MKKLSKYYFISKMGATLDKAVVCGATVYEGIRGRDEKELMWMLMLNSRWQ